jgi:formiminotetrahydrofolate cyclodeaminase
MRDETIGSFLGQLAARVPAPGGGATAALHAAQSAALVAMVARYSNGARYDTELMARLFTEADGLRDEALGLAEADAAAFGAVSDAYQLPKETGELLQVRSAAIAEALTGAARVNIEVNLRGIKDAAIKTELSATAAVTDEITARADRIVAAVRDEITR